MLVRTTQFLMIAMSLVISCSSLMLFCCYICALLKVLFGGSQSCRLLFFEALKKYCFCFVAGHGMFDVVLFTIVRHDARLS